MATSPRQVLVPKDTPCGCITQVSEGGPGAATSGAAAAGETTKKCTCACCGAGCRCVELKGRCDCQERLEAHVTSGIKEAITVPAKCVVEAGVMEGVECPTCGSKGCKCVEIKGRCDCLED